MNGVLLLALLLTAPSPAPASPPVIIQVHSKALCTTLRDNVRIALAGLMQNDSIVDAGRKAYRKMAADQVAKTSGGVSMDRLYVSNAVSAMVHNLAEIDLLLGDPKRFPVSGSNDDAREAVTMKAQLAAIADLQRKTLDLLNGALQSVPDDGGHPTNTALQDEAGIGDTGLRSAPDQIDRRTLATGISIAPPLFSDVADAIASQQAQAATLESKAAMTVMNVAAECSGAQR
jgi:hypothetical protein